MNLNLIPPFKTNKLKIRAYSDPTVFKVFLK